MPSSRSSATASSSGSPARSSSSKNNTSGGVEVPSTCARKITDVGVFGSIPDGVAVGIPNTRGSGVPGSTTSTGSTTLNVSPVSAFVAVVVTV